MPIALTFYRLFRFAWFFFQILYLLAVQQTDNLVASRRCNIHIHVFKSFNVLIKRFCQSNCCCFHIIYISEFNKFVKTWPLNFKFNAHFSNWHSMRFKWLPYMYTQIFVYIPNYMDIMIFALWFVVRKTLLWKKKNKLNSCLNC